MSKTALLLAFVTASCLSPALAIPLSGDRTVSAGGALGQGGPHRPSLVTNPGAPQADVVMGPHRPGFGLSAVDSAYLADR